MKPAICKALILACTGIFYAQPAARAENLDQIGVTVLRAMTTNLNGASIRVGQVEASAPPFEVNPSAVGQPTNLFTWIATTTTIVSIASYLPAPSTATNYPNSIGTESGHADAVGRNFYGIPNGVATNVAHVNNYDAATFYYHYVYYNNAITDRIVNQSFTFGTNEVLYGMEAPVYSLTTP